MAGQRRFARVSLGVAVAGAVVATLAACTGGAQTTQSAREPARARAPRRPCSRRPQPSRRRRRTPPAKVCGSEAILNGPAAAPDGRGPASRRATTPTSTSTSRTRPTGSRPASTRLARGVRQHQPGRQRHLHRRARRDPGRAAHERLRLRRHRHARHDRVPDDQELRHLGRRLRSRASSTTTRARTGRSPTRRSPTTPAPGSCSAATTRSPGTASQDNQQYGFNAYSNNGEITDLVLDHNEIAGNDTYDYEAKQPGCGCSGGGKFWNVVNAKVTSNWVHDNKSVGLWADTNNAGFEFAGNYISNSQGVGLDVRDQLQRGDRVQHLRPQRRDGRPGEHRLPDERDLHLRVGRRQPGQLGLQELAAPDRAQRLPEQLGRGHPLGELQPVLRIPGQHELWLLHGGEPEGDAQDLRERRP